MAEAQAKPSALNELLCKTFNVWVSANEAWVDRREWDHPECLITEENPDTPEAVFVGFDLAHTRDLNAVVLLKRYDMESYEAHFQYFLPEDRLAFIPTHYSELYRQAIKKGRLKLTRGNVMDPREIRDYVLQLHQQYEVYEIGYDSYNAAQVVADLADEHMPVKKVGQSMSVLNNPSKEVEKLILSHKIKHFDDPFTAWQLGNCEVYEDVNGNIKVRKK